MKILFCISCGPQLNIWSLQLLISLICLGIEIIQYKRDDDGDEATNKNARGCTSARNLRYYIFAVEYVVGMVSAQEDTEKYEAKEEV